MVLSHRNRKRLAIGLLCLLLELATAHAANDRLSWMQRPHPPDPVATPAPATAPGDHDADDDLTEVDADDPDASDQADGSDEDASTSARIAEASARPYVVNAASPAATAALAISPPVLPDLSPYTPQAAMAKIQHSPRGEAVVGSMLGEITLKSFMGGDGRLREWAKRQATLPRAIYIRHGYVTPQDLAHTLPKRYFEETAKGVYVARLPIDVRPDATLHIGKDVKDFRLSLDHGAFLANEGRVFITDSRLEAWNEAANAPASFVDKHDFRPFLISWGGSELYIIGSTVAHLGYAASKSYGVAISQFSPKLAPRLGRPRPTGWILNSEFFDNWYGFYCYEADGVVIRGNVYHDNIKYGIDPHDRSRHLIIADNEAYGTKEKHGIIVSREVDDSWIFDNRSHDNTLSGIVIDRSSINDVIARNEVYRNHADGITIYESPHTLIWRNLSSANDRHGIRVRNSVDVRLYDNVAIGNGLAGIYGHIKDLSGTGRNLRLDPFKQRVSMVVVGGKLVSNGSGPVTIDQPLSLELYNVDLRQPQRALGINFTGVLGRYQQQVLDILVRRKQAVIVKPADTTVSDAR